MVESPAPPLRRRRIASTEWGSYVDPLLYSGCISEHFFWLAQE
jgi:hypothetical protein